MLTATAVLGTIPPVPLWPVVGATMLLSWSAMVAATFALRRLRNKREPQDGDFLVMKRRIISVPSGNYDFERDKVDLSFALRCVRDEPSVCSIERDRVRGW